MSARIWILIFLLMSVKAGMAFPAEEKNYEQQSLERRQRVELLGFFLKDPKDAELPSLPLAVELFNRGVGHYEKKEYDLALEALEESLRQDPDNALAYELMGDIYYFQQQLPKARNYYQKAFELHASEGLKTKLNKIREEARVEGKLSTYLEKNFLIKYHGEQKHYDGFELRELLRETYRNLSQDFGYYFNHKVVVLLYDREEFQRVANQLQWASGLYDGKIRMPAYREGFGEGDLKTLMTHEMTHAFVAAMSLGRAPIWLHEGLAKYQERKLKKSPLALFQAALRQNTLIPVDRLMTQGAFGANDDLKYVGLFYEQSCELARYLVERYGMFQVKKILAECGKGKNSDEALRAVLRISPERLEKEWKEALSKKSN